MQHIKARISCTLFLDWLTRVLMRHEHHVVMYKGECYKYKSIDITK